MCIIFDAKHERRKNITRFVAFHFAKDLDKSRSNTGHVFTMANSFVSSKSILITTIILLTIGTK